ncbi:hypothetical protein XU18_5197 [Perkinsela sp. CCAP 1560/4]|nr:hypothetical protein XU18_5197 [Perkinsela sp. CCAP 1560/4]|eukprot:KNH01408.1 hypothetical protein XU18_5197 [Perkinsela sp. CCAP 1560/4]
MTLSEKPNLRTRWAILKHDFGRVSSALVFDVDRVQVIVQTANLENEGQTRAYKLHLFPDSLTVPIVLEVDRALLPHDGNSLLCSAYMTDTSKRVTRQILSISFASKEYHIATGIKVMDSCHVGPFTKRITAIYPSMGSQERHTFFADVHGTLYAHNASENKISSPTGSLSATKLLSHICQVSAIHCLSSTDSFNRFIGGQASCSGSEEGLLVIGDNDGFLRLSTLTAPEQILSLCTGHKAEVVAITNEMHIKHGFVQDFHLVSVDSADTLIIHDGYTGDIIHECHLRELAESFCADQKELYLLSIKQVEANSMTLICCLSDVGLEIFRIEVPSGILQRIGLINCTQQKLVPIYQNSTLQTEHFFPKESQRKEIPLFYSTNASQLRTISIDATGQLVEKNINFELTPNESSEKAN